MNTLSPYIRRAMDSYLDPPFHLTERVLFDYELLFVKDGEVEVTVEGQVYHGIPGDVFLFKPKVPHEIKCLNNTRLHQPHIHFDLYYQPDSPLVPISFRPLNAIAEEEMAWFREDITGGTEDLLPHHIRLNKPILVDKLTQDIIFEMERNFPYTELAVKGLFTQLWVHLLRESHWQRNKRLLSNWELLDRIKQYISHNSEETITLDELAELANFNKYYLSKLFKKAFNRTPIQYHAAVRLEKAKQLIQFTSLPLSAIAEKTGFQSIHAFSRAFRKQEGVSPSSYRKP